MRSSVFVPYEKSSLSTSETPSLPRGASVSPLCRTLPRTVMVGVIVTCRTMRRMPLGSTVSTGRGAVGGSSSAISRDEAHSGSSTVRVGGEVTCSVCPKPF